MPKFDVTIVQTIKTTVRIEAEDRSVAKSVAREAIHEDKISDWDVKNYEVVDVSHVCGCQ